MPHIALNSAEPGIRGLLRYRPETARPLSELTEVLLRGPGTLARGERGGRSCLLGQAHQLSERLQQVRVAHQVHKGVGQRSTHPF